MSLDPSFIKKVYRSILYAWLLAIFWSLGYGKPWIALSITIGTALASGLLASIEYVVTRAFVPGSETAKFALPIMALAQLPVMCAVIYGVVHWQRINLMAFAGGVVLVHFAIIAKLIGVRMVAQRKQEEKGPDAKSDRPVDSKEI